MTCQGRWDQRLGACLGPGHHGAPHVSPGRGAPGVVIGPGQHVAVHHVAMLQEGHQLGGHGVHHGRHDGAHAEHWTPECAPHRRRVHGEGGAPEAGEVRDVEGCAACVQATYMFNTH
jgi:hypothetical protein